MSEATVVIRVKGMTCEGCTASLTRALQATPGVKQAAVNLEKQLATVRYDSERLDEEQIRGVVKRVGFIPVTG